MLLEKCKAAFPGDVPTEELNRGNDMHEVAASLVYLQQHGLVTIKTMPVSGGLIIGSATITAKGIDFLEDDGGLSAILGVVTIKLHEDTLKALIETKIQESGASQPEKHQWTAALRALPADATKHLALKLMDLGLRHAPDAMQLLHTYLQNPPHL